MSKKPKKPRSIRVGNVVRHALKSDEKCDQLLGLVVKMDIELSASGHRWAMFKVRWIGPCNEPNNDLVDHTEAELVFVRAKP